MKRTVSSSKPPDPRPGTSTPVMSVQPAETGLKPLPMKLVVAIRASGIAPDAVVVVVKDSLGRANGRVHVSSNDDWRVVKHELGHAMFGLADEYTECKIESPIKEIPLTPTPRAIDLRSMFLRLNVFITFTP